MKKWLDKLCGKIWWKKLGGKIAWKSLVEEFFGKIWLSYYVEKLGGNLVLNVLFFLCGKLGGTVWWKNLWTKCIGKIRLKL